MSAKCPSCDSKILSFTTNSQANLRRLSCIDCGNQWDSLIENEEEKKSGWKSLFGFDD